MASSSDEIIAEIGICVSVIFLIIALIMMGLLGWHGIRKEAIRDRDNSKNRNSFVCTSGTTKLELQC